MQYTKIVHLIGGEKILITEQEFKDLHNKITYSPNGFIQLQGNIVNKNSIAYAGDHHASADMKRLEKYQEETDLKIKQDETKKLDWVEPDYYIDKHTGEKMYS